MKTFELTDYEQAMTIIALRVLQRSSYFAGFGGRERAATLSALAKIDPTDSFDKVVGQLDSIDCDEFGQALDGMPDDIAELEAGGAFFLLKKQAG